MEAIEKQLRKIDYHLWGWEGAHLGWPHPCKELPWPRNGAQVWETVLGSQDSLIRNTSGVQSLTCHLLVIV